MKIIQNITDNSKQKLNIVLDDGTSFELKMYFHPVIQKWAIDITYNDIIIRGKILGNHPNVLRQYRFSLPFGIACWTNTGIDPMTSGDFVNGIAELYILTKADTVAVEEFVYKAVVGI